MALAPNGDVFITYPGVNSIFILRDTNNDGVAETRFTFASNLNLPFGMAFWRDYFYVANTNASGCAFATSRVRRKPKARRERSRIYRARVIANTGRATSSSAPTGRNFMRSIGSELNVSVEPEPRAAILEFNPDGTGRRILATGTRNPHQLALDRAHRAPSGLPCRSATGWATTSFPIT